MTSPSAPAASAASVVSVAAPVEPQPILPAVAFAPAVESESEVGTFSTLASPAPQQACSGALTGALVAAPCPPPRARAPGSLSVLLIAPQTMTGVAPLGVLPAREGLFAQELVAVQTVETSAGRKPRSPEKPTAAVAPPPLPAPTAPQAPTPLLTAASSGSSSTFSVEVLAALLTLLIAVYPRRTQVLRLVATLLRPQALALGLKRPG